MIISTEAKKALDKIQHSFLLKKNFLNHVKASVKNPQLTYFMEKHQILPC